MERSIKKGTLKRFLGTLLCCCSLTAWGGNTDRENDDAAHTKYIEQQGDSYVIHVDALNPDNEMTLMDVLMLCPEIITRNGRTLTENLILGVDCIDLFLDQEAFLQQVKATEVSTVTIFTSPSVSQGVSGSDGIIDVAFKAPTSKQAHGKAVAQASTYGNGGVYADVTTHSQKLDVKGYAMANRYEGKVNPAEGTLTNRNLNEHLHLDLNWNISPDDQLIVKLFQQYNDTKAEYDYTTSAYTERAKEHLGSAIAHYEHTLNDKEASLVVEGGVEYNKNEEEEEKCHNVISYLQVECSTPLMTDDLWMTAGYTISYDHAKMEVNKQQYLQNDLYVQLNYKHGPWVLTLGDLVTRLDYKNSMLTIDTDGKDWSHHRFANTMVAIAGYKWGRHYVQGAFQKEFYVPSFDDFYEEAMGFLKYNPDFSTSQVWKVESRYTYQQRHFTLLGNVYHQWLTDLPTPQVDMTGARVSGTWHKGAFRLTAGAAYCHQHQHGGEGQPAMRDNFFSVKVAPTLLLGKGFRVSSSLIYNSRQRLTDNHPHLFANVKVNKDLGRHCNIFADFHDLAGTPTMTVVTADKVYHNRALTVGLTYRF